MAREDASSVLEDLAIGPGLAYCVINHGCKVNKVEADTVATYLSAQGARLSDCEDAGLIVVNTCTVTGEADKKARKAVRHALKLSPESLVVVTGCGAAIDPHGYEAIDSRVRVVDRFDLLEAIKPSQKAPLRLGSDYRTRVNIKIQDGCDHACTYCIVHVARGKARSVDAAQVVAEADEYFAHGAKELVLAGIDLGSYQSGNTGLAELVEALERRALYHAPEGELPARIRASSLEPMTVVDSFIDLLARSDGRICRHLHIPVQSGSSKVLGEMARPYTAEDFEALVRRLRDRVPSLSLTTDIIVGFPGETDDDFECTLELARACRFSKIHVFPYSKRAGTPAAERSDQVDPGIARSRAAKLRGLSEELRALDYRSRIGRNELVLVESRTALTESYHEIAIPEGAREGSLVPVTLC